MPREDQQIDHWVKRLEERIDPKWDSFSWLTVRAVLESANDVVAKAGPTIVRHRRARWVAAQRAAGVERAMPGQTPGLGSFSPDFVIDWTKLENPRFLLMGDPGEADGSQYAVIDPLLAVHSGGVVCDDEETPEGESPDENGKPHFVQGVPGVEPGHKTDFMVIVSDVIYPAGDINEYVNAFYLPYENYDQPIYALPGNHDWYDGLDGFMFHFCAAEPMPPLGFSRRSYRPGEFAVQLLWRGSSRPDREALAPGMAKRVRLAMAKEDDENGAPDLPADAGSTAWPCGVADFDDVYPPLTPTRRPTQPAPYFAIDTGPVMLVSIDTGVSGELDAEQGEWLRRVSLTPKPKILLTGKPIYDGNSYHPCEIVWGTDAPELTTGLGDEKRSLTVDDIVRERSNCYIAAIGGDTHNYQRYPVELNDGRTIQYVVSGGGGAYLSATHMIPTVGPTVDQELPPDVKGFREKDFRCYPLRGDSLALFTRRVGPILFNTILSAFALVIAAILVVLPLPGGLLADTIPVLELEGHQEEDPRGAIALAAFSTALLVIAIAAGFLMRDEVIRWLQGYRWIAVAGVAGLLALGTAALLSSLTSEISSAAGITLGLPFVLVAGVVLAYNLRGSAPTFLPSLLAVAPLVAVYEILVPHDGETAVRIAVDGIIPFAVGGVLLAMFEYARVVCQDGSRQTATPDDYWQVLRIFVTVGWAGLLFAVLAEHAPDPDGLLSDRDWLTRTILALVAATLVVARAIPPLSGGRRRAHQTDKDRRLGETASAMIAFTLIALTLMAVEAIGDDELAQVTAGAFSAFMGAASVILLLGCAYLRIGLITLAHMRSGDIDPDYTARFVAEKLGGGQPVRPPRTEQAQESKRTMAEAVRRLGKSVSEIADKNEPPFYKSFLRVEADEKEVVIRCYGVTGYSKVPSLEDCVRIPLPPRPRPADVEAQL